MRGARLSRWQRPGCTPCACLRPLPKHLWRHSSALLDAALRRHPALAGGTQVEVTVLLGWRGGGGGWVVPRGCQVTAQHISDTLAAPLFLLLFSTLTFPAPSLLVFSTHPTSRPTSPSPPLTQWTRAAQPALPRAAAPWRQHAAPPSRGSPLRPRAARAAAPRPPPVDSMGVSGRVGGSVGDLWSGDRRGTGTCSRQARGRQAGRQARQDGRTSGFLPRELLEPSFRTSGGR